MHSVRLEPTKLILIGTATTYQTTEDADQTIYSNKKTKTKRNNCRTKAQSTFPVAAAVCDRSSRAKFSSLVGLVPSDPVCRPRPAFLDYAPISERVRHTVRIKESRLVVHPRLETASTEDKKTKYDLNIYGKITQGQAQQVKETTENHVLPSPPLFCPPRFLFN